ncbi:MAG: phosphonate metabolism transcriptional regulator PhnF [Proteobacteria bacterium]|nr:phosphonate metabolism transcriptional regulator PhnF [Pseudomonadota bacterium]MBI3499814.1 phosphonate metabolism transcriptional regulator PhnF [Pseudomonadota bacterium]
MKVEGISRWRRIGDAIVRDIDQGVLSAGDKLPAEIALASRYGVARQTIRRALSHLQSEGLLRVEHGRGTFVTDKVFEYRISARKTFEENLAENSMTPRREMIEMHTLPATQAIAAKLELELATPVLFVGTLGKADGMPVALARIYFPSSRMTGVENAFKKAAKGSPERFSVSATLGSIGIAQYRRKDIRLRAREATREDIEHLEVAPGDYVIETESVSIDRSGQPVFYSIMAYPSDRVQFYIGGEAFELAVT